MAAKFIKPIKELFSKEEVNHGRQLELDVAKVILLFLMVFCHCIMPIHGAGGGSETTYTIFNLILGGFIAAGFMFCMGTVFIYSRKTAPKTIIKRGFILFLIGIALDIMRGVIPVLLLAWTSGETQYFSKAYEELWSLDILHFAGLALILFGVLKWMKATNFHIAVIAIIMSIIGTLFRDFNFGIPEVNQLVGLFIGTEFIDGFENCFPLFNWFIFVAAGYFFGQFLSRCKDKKTFYLYITPIALVITVIYTTVAFIHKFGMFGTSEEAFYHLPTFEAFICILSAISIIGICYIISLGLPKLMRTAVISISKNVNAVYCIHWVLVGWIVEVLLGEVLNVLGSVNDFQFILIATGIFVVSALAAEVYSRWKIKIKNSKQIRC